ncbi:hypothetical protein [Rhodoferax mekongensis]|uniref:Uncharacterized protein n=1 Tax=Rhodoferax mekongensis TaxID=3068341 RepID=A0ABZ0AWX8_9BURK|nr:hypothetical protein [Rhodoferax sp. TBRC 17307]WNO03972.1 hypothetical protein RAN89_13775 [Rhodoferax sp. TBRC 17307]
MTKPAPVSKKVLSNMKPVKRISWSSLAKHAFEGLSAVQRRSVKQRVEKIEDEGHLSTVLTPFAKVGENLYVVPVLGDQVRLVMSPGDKGWTLLDVARPVGGFSFADLSSIRIDEESPVSRKKAK